MGCILNNEAGTKVDKGIDIKDYNPSDNSRLQGGIPSPSKDRVAEYKVFPGFSLDVQWTYAVHGRQIKLPIESLVFSVEECRFAQKGVDENGGFVIEGQFAVDGAVKAALWYNDRRHNRTFVGRFADEVVEGEWEDEGHVRDKFKLDLILKVYKADPLCLMAKENSKEPVGIARLSYGYAVFTGDIVKGEGKAEEYLLRLRFGDGKQGSFDVKFMSEGLAGQVVSPKGTEDLTMTVKNEFE